MRRRRPVCRRSESKPRPSHQQPATQRDQKSVLQKPKSCCSHSAPHSSATDRPLGRILLSARSTFPRYLFPRSHFAKCRMSPLTGAPMNRDLLAKCLLALAAITFLAAISPAQDKYQPSPENLKARQDFQDDKFGLFIHWGVYSVLGDGEWVLHDRKLQLHDYERLPNVFNPEKFDAQAWVALAKAAGMKYITITSRHHDGFSMFDSKLSDWNIVERTPYKRDPLKMLADEAHRQGIKLYFYYSQLDWHNPDYFPRGSTAWDNGRPNQGDWNAYIENYMNGQLRELLTNYG